MTIVRSDPNSPGHGGARKGAGRPAEYDAPRVKTSLRRDMHGMLSKACRKTGCLQTHALDLIVGRVIQDPALENALRALAAGHENDAKKMLSSRIVVVAPKGVKAEEAKGGVVVARVTKNNQVEINPRVKCPRCKAVQKPTLVGHPLHSGDCKCTNCGRRFDARATIRGQAKAAERMADKKIRDEQRPTLRRFLESIKKTSTIAALDKIEYVPEAWHPTNRGAITLTISGQRARLKARAAKAKKKK